MSHNNRTKKVSITTKHINIKSVKLTGKRISSPGNPLKGAQLPLNIQLPYRPPTHRSVKVYETSTTVLNMIDTDLSLNLSNISPNSNNRLNYAERITGIVNTPITTSSIISNSIINRQSLINKIFS